MAIFALTTGPDTFVGGPGDNTVYATAATLNAGDSLTGGVGTDVLALIGSGMFSVDQLATFTGFEKITIDNATNSFAFLTLGNQPIEVDATGFFQINVNLPSDWNVSDIINGDSSRFCEVFFSNFGYPPGPQTYDLTSNTFSNINYVGGNGNDLTLLINSSDTAGIRSFNSGGTNDNLVTTASTLDLSKTTVSGFRVSSTNGVGTTFTVSDLGTAFQIAGGPGHDTLIAQGLTLTANERAEIFVTNSIETITDQSGTYNAAPPLSPPTLSVSNGKNAMRGQVINLSTLASISDPGSVGYERLELWDSNGTALGGQFVVNGLPQTGGHEIDVSPVNVASTLFDVGTLGGTDTLWARLLQHDGTLTSWQQFTVTAPIDTPPVVTVLNLFAAHDQSFVASTLFQASDPDGDVITEYDFWDTGTGGGHFALNNQVLGANQNNYVSAAQLTQTTYQSGSGADMPVSPMIEITYCRLWGWGLRAGWMAQELLTTFAEELGSVTLTPDRTGGVFEVRIDDEVIWSRKERGRFPEIKEIKQLKRRPRSRARVYGQP